MWQGKPSPCLHEHDVSVLVLRGFEGDRISSSSDDRDMHCISRAL